MTDEISANPSGADTDSSINVNQAAERFRGMLGREATDETRTDQGDEQSPVEAEAPAEADTQPLEESEPVESQEAEEQPTGRYKVKVNGEEKTVTFDELRKGYQLESDYRQKTARLAEERKTLEAERTHYADQLKGIIPALQTQLQDKYANVDWVELAKSDPAQYVSLQAEYQQYATRLQIAQAEQHRIETQTQAQRTAEMKERLQQEQTRLAEKIPEFSDPVKGPVLRTELKSFLKKTGYTDDEIAGLGDSRAALIAYKAMKYDKAQEARVVAAKQGTQQAIPKVQRPGTSTRADPKLAAVSAATERFGQTGKVADLAAVLRARGR